MPELVNTETGNPVKEGETLKDFRGETWEYVTITSRRKISVKKPDSSNSYSGREFNSQVFPGYEIR
jgi:hypothetical protein